MEEEELGVHANLRGRENGRIVCGLYLSWGMESFHARLPFCTGIYQCQSYISPMLSAHSLLYCFQDFSTSLTICIQYRNSANDTAVAQVIYSFVTFICKGLFENLIESKDCSGIKRFF